MPFLLGLLIDFAFEIFFTDYIVASKPVDAFNVKQVVRLEFFDQLFVLGTIEVLSGLLVNEDIFLWDRHFS